MLFMLLYKAVHLPQEVSEQSLALIIYLVDLAASLALTQSVSHGNVSLSLLLFLSRPIAIHNSLHICNVGGLSSGAHRDPT